MALPWHSRSACSDRRSFSACDSLNRNQQRILRASCYHFDLHSRVSSRTNWLDICEQTMETITSNASPGLETPKSHFSYSCGKWDCVLNSSLPSQSQPSL